MAVYPPYTGEAWYNYSIYSDYPETSYHNTDVGTPTDTPLTAPLGGKITADTFQPWGGQLTIQADDPSQIGGYPYYFLIHMDAINPGLHVGSHVNQGDFLGYSGGQLDNSGLQALPGGLQHHVTSPDHSTGPHLDIGVTNSPQGSMDASQQWSDRLVNIARQLKIPFGTGQGSSGSSGATKGDWAVDLLNALGNPNPDQAQIQFVSAWEHAESGSSGGAQNNPLNTEEQYTPGVISDFNPQGVKNYDTYQHGIQAEAKVLNNGLYPDLLAALQTPGASSDAALGVPGGQPSAGVVANLQTWGTSDWNTIYGNLSTAGSEPINTTGGSGICAACAALPQSARPVYCLACSIGETISSTVTGAAGSLLPSWLSTPPWQNKDLTHALARLGFITLGGVLIVGAGFLAVQSLGEETGVTEKVNQAVTRIGAAVATEGASEAGRAASKKPTLKKPAAEKATPAKKPPPSERFGR